MALQNISKLGDESQDFTPLYEVIMCMLPPGRGLALGLLFSDEGSFQEERLRWTVPAVGEMIMVASIEQKSRTFGYIENIYSYFMVHFTFSS